MTPERPSSSSASIHCMSSEYCLAVIFLHGRLYFKVFPACGCRVTGTCALLSSGRPWPEVPEVTEEGGPLGKWHCTSHRSCLIRKVLVGQIEGLLFDLLLDQRTRMNSRDVYSALLCARRFLLKGTGAQTADRPKRKSVLTAGPKPDASFTTSSANLGAPCCAP